MRSIKNWFEELITEKQAKASVHHTKVLTVIGCGGKTSLIQHLAASFSPHYKVLVTTTTKMFPPPPLPGVELAGVFNEKSGKLESLPPDELEQKISSFDLVLIEGDGSQGLPLKAWQEGEPVVPQFTDLTIGVIPLWPLGKPVSNELVHRLPLFLELTGARVGEAIEARHIQRLICGRSLPGLFDKALGKKVLFFNQIEDEKSLKQARQIAEGLPADFRSALSGIVAGSVREDMLEEL